MSKSKLSIMKNEYINFDVIKEYIIFLDEDGFKKESVEKVYIGNIYEPIGKNSGKYIDVIFVEGKCVLFDGYKTWITLEKYKEILREYNLKKIIR